MFLSYYVQIYISVDILILTKAGKKLSHIISGNLDQRTGNIVYDASWIRRGVFDGFLCHFIIGKGGIKQFNIGYANRCRG